MNTLTDLAHRAWAFGLEAEHLLGHLARTTWAFTTHMAHHMAEANRQHQPFVQQKHEAMHQQAAGMAHNDAMALHQHAHNDAMATHEQADSDAMALHQQAVDSASFHSCTHGGGFGGMHWM